MEKAGEMNLNEEDRKWIKAELAEQSLAHGAQLDRHSAAIKSYVDSRLEQQRSAIEERITDVETKLLTEFHKWASPTELRIQSHATAMRAIDLELEHVKERVGKLEPKQ